MHRMTPGSVLVIAALLALPATLNSQSASASLTVTANVQKNCTITTAAVSFGPYDPVSANNTTPLDSIGTIIVACTKGATAKVGLNNGSNNQGETRRMSQGALQYLTYELYKDANRTDVWGDGLTNSMNIGAAPSLEPRTFTTYGRVPPGQDATVGAYTDTVVATVNF